MMEEYFNTLLQETERRMAAAAAGMEGKETVATCREMVSYLKAKNRELKAYALARPFSGNEEEIRYFKYYKPALTGRLLYYYRVYQIESGCPGCLRVAETYYRRAMERAERMMERYLPFYQYYHSGATYRDDYYFLRAKGELSPESGSFVLDEEAEFSTGYDILAARLISVEMLLVVTRNFAASLFRNIKYFTLRKKKFFPIKTTIFVHKENSYYTMNHTVEDLSLFNALRQGDGNSFDHLFRRYYPMLCAYAHRLVSLEDAEEIVQEVMLWLWENRGDLIIESSLNQYLFKMTYRRVLNHLTREQVKTKAEAAFYERTQAALCEVDYGRFEELDRKIKEAMAALPDSYREAFVMHRFKELSYKEIAEVLDVSPQTVAYRIQQALKLLRVSLKDYLPMLVWLVG